MKDKARAVFAVVVMYLVNMIIRWFFSLYSEPAVSCMQWQSASMTCIKAFGESQRGALGSELFHMQYVQPGLFLLACCCMMNCKTMT